MYDLLHTNASPVSQKINLKAPLYLLYNHITCFSYSEAVLNVSHYTITWFLWIACNREYFNQVLKQEFKEHGGRETVNGLTYSYSGSAVLQALFFPNSHPKIRIHVRL